eukprot:1487171-Amphidinium_carterae.1
MVVDVDELCGTSHRDLAELLIKCACQDAALRLLLDKSNTFSLHASSLCGYSFHPQGMCGRATMI